MQGSMHTSACSSHPHFSENVPHKVVTAFITLYLTLWCITIATAVPLVLAGHSGHLGCIRVCCHMVAKPLLVRITTSRYKAEPRYCSIVRVWWDPGQTSALSSLMGSRTNFCPLQPDGIQDKLLPSPAWWDPGQTSALYSLMGSRTNFCPLQPEALASHLMFRDARYCSMSQTWMNCVKLNQGAKVVLNSRVTHFWSKMLGWIS
jgi:hypothetical protein